MKKRLTIIFGAAVSTLLMISTVMTNISASATITKSTNTTNTNTEVWAGDIKVVGDPSNFNPANVYIKTRDEPETKIGCGGMVTFYLSYELEPLGADDNVYIDIKILGTDIKNSLKYGDNPNKKGTLSVQKNCVDGEQLTVQLHAKWVDFDTWPWPYQRKTVWERYDGVQVKTVWDRHSGIASYPTSVTLHGGLTLPYIRGDIYIDNIGDYCSEIICCLSSNGGNWGSIDIEPDGFVNIVDSRKFTITVGPNEASKVYRGTLKVTLSKGSTSTSTVIDLTACSGKSKSLSLTENLGRYPFLRLIYAIMHSKIDKIDMHWLTNERG